MTTSKLVHVATCAALALAVLPGFAADVSKPMATDQSHMTDMKPMQMHNKTGDVDYDFASMMRMHHQMGIAMAQEQVKNGKDSEMKNVAQKIIAAQQEEMKQFDTWLAKHKPTPSGVAK